MNIAAVMEALDEWGIDPTAKHALLCLCCRADQTTWIAQVSFPRLAADMSCHYDTASRAVRRLVALGVVEPVERRPGMRSKWRLYPAVCAGGTPRSVQFDPPRPRGGTPRVGAGAKESFGENQRGGAAPNGAAPPGDNPPAPVWVELPDGTVRRAHEGGGR